jgi:hypothetical protein
VRKAMGGFAAAVLVAVPVGLFVAPAGAQPYPPGSCDLGLSLSTATPGETVVASTVNCGSPYVAGAEVTLSLNSDPVFLKTVTADANGHFSTPVTIPANAPLGGHTVQSSGAGVSGSTLVLDADLMLVGSGGPGAARSGGGGQLAFTGGWVLALIAAALVCLTAGTALMVGARRRAEVRRQFS